MKRLYEVRAEVVQYVLAESEREAVLTACADCENEPQMWDFEAREVKYRNHALDGGWDKDALIYGADEDTTLGEALDALPEAKR